MGKQSNTDETITTLNGTTLSATRGCSAMRGCSAITDKNVERL